MKADSLIDIIIDSIKPVEVKYGFDIKALKKLKQILNLDPEDIGKLALKGKNKTKYYNAINNNVYLSELEKINFINYLTKLKEVTNENWFKRN